MCSQAITFREMMAPLAAEEFFERWHDRQPLHIPGDDDKFAAVFSWPELNRLLNMSNVWSGKTMKIVRDGQSLAPEDFCRPVYNREGVQAMQADPAAVRGHLRDGATMVLDFVESLCPAVASVSAALQTWFGGPASCNVYCSWQSNRGFAAHFDTTDVVALQIAGAKTWRVYDGRFEHPLDAPGYETTGFSQDYHERAKGALQATVTLTPGDLLYLPRGQYHEALASSEASLHLTFGVNQATGYDVLTGLTDELLENPLFRKVMPFFDDPAAHSAHVARLADSVRDAIAASGTSESVRRFQRNRAFLFCYPEFALPDRRDPVIYRLRAYAARLVRRGSGFQLQARAGKADLSAGDAPIAEWMLARDFFSAEELSDAFLDGGTGDIAGTIEACKKAGVLEVI